MVLEGNMEEEKSNVNVEVKTEKIEKTEEIDLSSDFSGKSYDVENKKGKLISIRLNARELEMMRELKKEPYSLNMSRYIRACIRHIYERRVVNGEK